MNTEGIVTQIFRIRDLANRFIEKELQKRDIEGIVPAHGSVLLYLFRQGKPVPIKAVVANVGRVKSTVTGMLNTLERRGYIQKNPCGNDNRVTYVTLTDKGRLLRQDFEEISMKLLKKVYGDFPKRKRKKAVTMLKQIEKNLIR